ncbi:hypothetical protein V8F44DRAFT_531450 [Aspergillus fumigatus]
MIRNLEPIGIPRSRVAGSCSDVIFVALSCAITLHAMPTLLTCMVGSLSFYSLHACLK